ncbi:MAG: 4-hydroxybenzoate octaprenyltransferase [Candidatus Levyibacteriota bacterium]
MSGPVPAARPRLTFVERLDAYERLLRLDKPIGTLLLLWPTLSALWLATRGAPAFSLIVIFVMGTWVMRSAGCAFNDWADRDFDAHVKRTAQRPLAAGIIAPWEALAVGAVLAAIAFCFVLFTNRTTVLWSFPALAIAVAYPFFKRFFSIPQAFLGIAFSFGIPMAYAAAQDSIPPIAWMLLAINLFWVVAYDTEYAMVDRDDDAKIGIRTSALTFGRYDVAAVALCYAVYLAAMAWVGRVHALGWVYGAGLAIALAIAIYHLRIIRTRERDPCFRAFLGNHWLGLAVFAGIALDYALRAGRWPHSW